MRRCPNHCVNKQMVFATATGIPGHAPPIGRPSTSNGSTICMPAVKDMVGQNYLEWDWPVLATDREMSTLKVCICAVSDNKQNIRY